MGLLRWTPKITENEAFDPFIPDDRVDKSATDEFHVTDEDIALYRVLDPGDTDIDYIAQLSAAHDLLQREKVADQLLTSAIKKREEFVKNATGLLNQMHAEDDWLDHMYRATYQDAARSMAAVGMLAPLAESLFYHSFSGIQRILETNSVPVGSSLRPKEDWDCHYVWGKTSRRRDLAAGIIQMAEFIGLDNHLPNDVRHTLQALFMYRNKMFHWGFEWPAQQREKFSETTNAMAPGVVYVVHQRR